MLSTSSTTLLWWANEIRIWAAVVAAVAAILTAAASYYQIRLQAEVSKEKDVAFERYRLEAEQRTALAVQKAEEARAESLELSVQLEKEKSERLHLEGRVASRRITDNQREVLIREIKLLLPVRIYVVLTQDQEAHIYGRNLARVLETAGADVTILEPTITPFPTGLSVSGRKALALARALMAARISFAQGESEGPLKLTVGVKPPAI